MKKGLKIGIIVLVVIMGCGIIFGSIDKKRALDNKRPIFVVRTTIYKDGGSKEYIGLGYKVIVFNTLCGYKEVKFGSWQMNINDFEQETTDYCSKNEHKLDKDANNLNTVKSNVVLELKSGTLKKTKATFILKNNSNVNITYGNEYKIEKKIDDNWQELEEKLAFNLPAYNLKYMDSVELKLDWKNGYGSLDKGQYRLVKSVSVEKVDGSSEEFNVYGEFNID